MQLRQIMLDTETTGLEPTQGHRVIEIGCVEIVNRRYTGNNFHRYLNPERDSDEKALEIHGLSREFLLDKPVFASVVDEFLAYIGGAELVIHNAAFDVGFLDAELGRLNRGSLRDVAACVTDTMRMAKDLHPGKRSSLDALCDRYQIDNSKRTFHGALLDAELLGDVYLAMTRGQDSLLIEMAPSRIASSPSGAVRRARNLRVLPPTAEELAAHHEQLRSIAKTAKGGCLWLQLEPEGG